MRSKIYTAGMIWEIVLFILFCAIITMWGMLIHYSGIRRVVVRSRCAAEKRKYQSGSIHSVASFDVYNKPLYRVDYDFNSKTYNHSCQCSGGNNVNTFNIPVYDMKMNKTATVDKFCSCDNQYDVKDPSNPIYFKGDPGLVRFMNSADTTVFTSTI